MTWMAGLAYVGTGMVLGCGLGWIVFGLRDAIVARRHRRGDRPRRREVREPPPDYRRPLS